MIDTVKEQQTTCKVCGRPIIQKAGKGHRQRQYCNDVCKQTAYRARKRQQPNAVTIVDDSSAERRIAELEQKVKELSARLALEDAYHYDTEVRHFKSWLRKHSQARDTTEVFKRILADIRLPQHGSRSLYERPPHNILHVVGRSKLAKVGCPNGLRSPQILANVEGIGYA